MARLVIVVALLTACSGDDGPEAADTTTSSTVATATTTTTVTFSGDPRSPFCQQLAAVDPATLLDGDAADPSSVEQAFRELVGVLRDIQALAPPEIAGDARVVADGMAAFDEALAAVGYDFDALAASGAGATVTEAVNDPAFKEAGDRLGAYRTQVCHL